ncbi:hypothetical protein FGO68_gene8397 [Halteria grandinella]|uniref:Uncharacterized protein n=1 Tax=Halteria grandinella TaxID=5974 RepID=A0A8J8P1G2_HALGN|nr:hypothetical protein FGO68_gene8397 [Halteria grandinella]
MRQLQKSWKNKSRSDCLNALEIKPNMFTEPIQCQSKSSSNGELYTSMSLRKEAISRFLSTILLMEFILGGGTNRNFRSPSESTTLF